MSVETVEAFDPNPTLGALLIGTLLGSILFGVTTAQAYIYYKRFPDDHWAIKATVVLVWCAEAAHMGALSHTLYLLLIRDYGHPEALLARPDRAIIGYIFLSLLIAVVVQIFFSYRIYVLSRSRLIPYFTWALSSVHFASGTALFAVGFSVKSLNDFGTRWEWLGVMMWSLSATADVIITATLVYLLWKERGRVHESTRTFLDKLILWSLETGLITSSFSLITVILFHTMPKNLFSNSFFASLNSRTVLRELRDNKNGQMLSWTNPALRQTATAPQQLPISVSVAVHTMQDVDSDQDTELTLMPVKETEHC